MKSGRMKLLPWLKPRMVPTPDRKQSALIPVKERPCGDCTACCTIMPVSEIKKPAHEACQHLAPSGGCAIYKKRPGSCFAWSCLWVLDRSIPEELRPDRCHVIFDMMADTVTAEASDGKKTLGLTVLVAWGDPAFPDAHRAPIVRELMNEVAEKVGIPTLVRMSDEEAFAVAAPCLAGGENWYEPPSRLEVGSQGPE